jgi:hypothetical protein
MVSKLPPVSTSNLTFVSPSRTIFVLSVVFHLLMALFCFFFFLGGGTIAIVPHSNTASRHLPPRFQKSRTFLLTGDSRAANSDIRPCPLPSCVLAAVLIPHSVYRANFLTASVGLATNPVLRSISTGSTLTFRPLSRRWGTSLPAGQYLSSRTMILLNPAAVASVLLKLARKTRL